MPDLPTLLNGGGLLLVLLLAGVWTLARLGRSER